jgi:hypothetical protein
VVSDHQIIVVHVKLNAIYLHQVLTVAFTQSQDEAGKTILSAKKELPDKLADLCATSFKTKNYLLRLMILSRILPAPVK